MSEAVRLPIEVPDPRPREAARQRWIDRLARFPASGPGGAPRQRWVRPPPPLPRLGTEPGAVLRRRRDLAPLLLCLETPSRRRSVATGRPDPRDRRPAPLAAGAPADRRHRRRIG